MDFFHLFFIGIYLISGLLSIYESGEAPKPRKDTDKGALLIQAAIAGLFVIWFVYHGLNS